MDLHPEPKRTTRCGFLGRVAYAEATALQESLRAGLGAGALPESFLLLEHPAVYTLGRNARREDLLADRRSLAARGIEVHGTNRGGQVTYHGPGQVVIYTLIDLHRLGIFVKELVYRIEQAVIQTLAEYGVRAQRARGAPGVYVPIAHSAAGGELAGLAKIAALGIKVSRGRSYHGVALNVAMDLSPFARINPCGYAGLSTVDLATLGIDISWQTAADDLRERLVRHFLQ